MEPCVTTLHGLKLAVYERPGNRPCLFFVHGNSSNAAAFGDVWDSEFLSSYHLISMDLPGHGDSGPSQDGTAYTMSALGKLIADVIELKGLRDVIFVGHSIGGHIATSALNFTDRVIGISLSGTGLLNSADDLSDAYIMSDAVETVLKGETTEEEILAFSRHAVHKVEKAGPVIKAFKETDKRFRDEMRLELGRYFGSENFLSEIESLRRKNLAVCMIYGAEEKIVSLDYVCSIDTLNLFEGKVHIVANAGHGVPFESPEEYARILGKFVSGLSGGH